MKFIVLPIDKVKELLPTEWEFCRKSNDGSKAIIHKEIYDELVPEEKPAPAPMMMRAMPMAASVEEPIEEPKEREYPYPIVTGEELNEMEEFMSKEEMI